MKVILDLVLFFWDSMVKKTKRKRSPRVASKPTDKKISSEQILSSIEVHEQAERYKDVIKLYKDLLKLEQRAEWLQALSRVYVLRADQLAGKGMFKEALVMWDNRLQLTDSLEPLDGYCHCLIGAGQVHRAAQILVEAPADFQNSNSGRQVLSQLALFLLADDDKLAAMIVEKFQLNDQLTAILAAIDAYCQGQDDKMEQALSVISFRSPFKDLRQILRALSISLEAPDKSKDLLVKIKKDSAYYRFSELHLLLNGEPKGLLKAISNSQPQEQKFIFEYMNVPENQRFLFAKLQNIIDQQARPKELFQFAVQYVKYLDESQVKQFCLSLLPSFMDGAKLFKKHLGDLPEVEFSRLKALAFEEKKHYSQALSEWQHYIDLLLQEKVADANLKVACVYKYMAAVVPPAEFREDNIKVVYLTQALKYDPKDREAYLRLFALLQSDDDWDGLHRWAEIAAKQLPDDDEILLRVAQTSYRRGAFKKAAQYANKLIKRDSINKSARSLLLNCHLSHAYKQVKTKKITIIQKELDQAFKMAGDDKQKGLVTLNLGLFHFAMSKDREQAMDIVLDGFQQMGASLSAELRFLVDGSRFKLTDAALRKHYKVLQKHRKATVEKSDVTRFIDDLNRFRFEKNIPLGFALGCISKSLPEIDALDFEEKELQQICRTLDDIGFYPLLAKFAEIGVDDYDDCPIFVYYQVLAIYKQHSKVSPIYFDDLVEAMHTAEEEDDFKTAFLIGALLDEIHHEVNLFDFLNPIINKRSGSRRRLF